MNEWIVRESITILRHNTKLFLFASLRGQKKKNTTTDQSRIQHDDGPSLCLSPLNVALCCAAVAPPPHAVSRPLSR